MKTSRCGGSRTGRAIAAALALAGVCAFCGRAQEAARAAAVVAGAAMGQELKQVEKLVTEPAPPRAPAVPVITAPAATNGAPAAGDGEARLDVRTVRIRGDEADLERLGVLAALRAQLEGQSLSASEAKERVKAVSQQLVRDGYYLARLAVAQDAVSNGVLVVDADLGRVGRVQYVFPDEQTDGRYFTRRQLERRMAGMPEGSPFNYRVLYERLFEVNSHPDLKIDTDLRIRKELADDRLSRFVDPVFKVHEHLPVHVVLDIDNYGTEATDEWGVKLTAQHLNLTKHDDVLTVSLPASIDFSSLLSAAASYYWPYYAGNGGGLTAYGGYSELDSKDVVEDVDIVGTGWFGGAQWSHNLHSSPAHLLKGSVGVVRRYIDDQLFVADYETEPRDVEVMPFSLAFGYTGKQADWLNGRNYATLQALYNAGDFLGTSDEDEIQTQRTGAEADYYIGKLQVGRVQPFAGRLGEDGRRTGQWILFAKAEGQAASGALVPAEQIGVGGAKSVRGYVEREYLGDHGAFGSLELRTPLLLGLLTRPFDAARGKDPLDRLQLVTFVDGGFSSYDGGDDETLASAGLGFRLAVSSHSQLKADWGFPLKETDESNSTGAGHVNFQLQF